LDEEYDDRPRRSQYDDYDAPPRRGGFPWLIVISVLIILGGGATLVILLTTGKDGSGSGDTISNLDEKKLSKAIGHVICGAEIIQPDGTLIEIPTTSGSSFMISPMGHLMTNKHVIESVQKQLRSPQLKRKNEESDRIIRPRVWVFLEAKKYQAEILHVSDEFDMAILKIDETTPNYFRLSNSTEFSRNIEVVACGFPGAAEGTVSFEEEVKKKVTEKVLHEKVEKYYNQRDFIFSSVKGPISRVFAEETGRNWIQHAANIIHGYSGGPLLTEDGTVVGINTRVADANIGKNFQIAPGIGYALTMPQMRKEIDRIVKDVNWK
jgi:S1-C subfamily serine protease